MASDSVGNTNAVFTSDRFDRQWHPDGGDSYPPPGRDFAVAIGHAFAAAGWDVWHIPADPPSDTRNDHWEHTYWYMSIDADSDSYWVYVEPIGEDDVWRIAIRPRRGCLTSLFRRQSKFAIASRIKADTETVIHGLTNCDDLRWVTDLEAESLW